MKIQIRSSRIGHMPRHTRRPVISTVPTLSLYVYLYAYIYIYIYNCLYIYRERYIHIHTYVYIYIYIYPYTYTYIYIYIYVCHLYRAASSLPSARRATSRLLLYWLIALYVCLLFMLSCCVYILVYVVCLRATSRLAMAAAQPVPKASK